MKNTNNEVIQKNNKHVNLIISFLILLPLCFLIYNIKVKKNDAYKIKSDTLSNSVDSNAIKLQAAIDLAKSNPNGTNYINLSLEYYNNRKYKECVDATKKALEFDSQSYIAYNNMCTAYNQLGLWDEAIVAGNKALEIAPGNQLATNNLKVSTDGKASQDKSITDAETLVKTSPSEKNYIRLGNIYYGARKYEKAINSFQKALSYNHNNIIVYNNICSAYNELGKWKEAAENCEKALRIDSSYVLSKNNLKLAKENLKK